jgi:hypothetical protein
MYIRSLTDLTSSGGECLAMKEEMKDDHTVPGSGDLAAYMMDYSEEDASIGTLPCHHYVLGNMDFDESEFSLFADDSDKVDTVDKSGNNTVNWDAVDTLLRCCCPLCDIHVFLLVFHLMQKKIIVSIAFARFGGRV